MFFIIFLGDEDELKEEYRNYYDVIRGFIDD